MTEHASPPNAIHVHAAIHIEAQPELVAAIYRDVDRWGTTFPATIEKARVISTNGTRQQVEVTHKTEGIVSNTLIRRSPTQLWLEENKHKFSASFLNEFKAAANGGTNYEITAHVRPKGAYRLLEPFLKAYVRRRALTQIRAYVLEPLKAAAERTRHE